MRKYVLFLLCCCSYAVAYTQLPKDFVIPVKVIANGSPASITLSWPANPDAASYTIKRKTVTDNSYNSVFTGIGSIITDAATATSFTDNDIVKGTLYEYEISGNFNTTLPAARSSYICAGINILPSHNRGSIILLCESGIVNELQEKINRLYQDLAGDGWKVIFMMEPASDNTSAVKRLRGKIIDVYNDNPDLKQILILGHVPVPYSGDFGPDGHSEHIGCWPADGYYGDLTGTWTDTITSHTLAGARAENKNFPGDGKFDQSDLRSVQIAVGRVDLSNLPAFGMAETDLVKRYLDKDHAFRYGEIQLTKQALVEDNFPAFAEKFSQSAWKSYAATVGYDNVLTGQYETDLLSPAGYLWSYGSGAGIYTGASGICLTSDFVSNAYKTVFTQLFGSYFGDWDSQDNFMRASIASGGNTLTCVWGGRPHWYFHHMSTGLPIGYSTLLTMNNNNGIYNNAGSSNAQVHIGLMGDPTLRSSYIKPATNITATVNITKINVLWRAPAASAITGYYLYRSSSVTGNFTLLHTIRATDSMFIDSTPLPGNNVYMVRSFKIDSVITAGDYTNSSTYYNLATGAFDSAFFNIAAPQATLSLQPLAAVMLTSSPKQVVIMGDSSKRYFVGEKRGIVKLYNNSFSFLGPYLTLFNVNEGFFSMAFHPDFENNKLLYVFYTNAAGNLELARYKENASTTTATLQGIMFTIPATANTKNLGGEIHFGPGGYLYISTGDADTKDAALNNAQNTNSLLGKILRILPVVANTAPYYTIPPDNPYGNEVFATGLRFPYRWGFDKLTNDVWIGDRGDSSIEEINRIAFDSLKGANFGWRCYQGKNAFNSTGCGAAANYNFPVYQFASPLSGGSVTGGTVYRGETFMALKDCYVFADASNGNVYLSRYDSLTNKYNSSAQILSPGAISDISEDVNGELYVTSLLGGVYRLESDAGRRYRFSGNGNWDNANNWSNKTIPPAVLPAGSEIIISPVVGGECVLNVPQTISAGSKIIIGNNQHFRIIGNLTVQ